MKLFVIIFTITLIVAVLPGSSIGQSTVEKLHVPADFENIIKFAPPGWKVEEPVPGDLNGDGVSDYAIKLVESKTGANDNGDPIEKQRALVIVFGTSDGQLTRAAVNNKLLQCTRCGGAFYGVVESPANVKIEKGVLVIDQDHGSRNLTNTTYRFRYDPASQKFVLIGFDFSDADRATAGVVSESTNYSTGLRIVTRSQGARDIRSRTQIPKTKVYLEQVDSEQYEAAAAKRLRL